MTTVHKEAVTGACELAPLTAQAVTEKLLASDPPIHVQRPGAGQLLISVWMMRGEEHKIVGRRLREIFQA